MIERYLSLLFYNICSKDSHHLKVNYDMIELFKGPKRGKISAYNKVLSSSKHLFKKYLILFRSLCFEIFL